MDHATLIRELGGPDTVAAVFGMHRTGVVRWRTSGIPPARFPQVVALAVAHGIPATLDDLYAGRTPRKARASWALHPLGGAWADLYGQGLSVRTIARQAGVSHETVRRHLLAQGVQMRPSWKAAA